MRRGGKGKRKGKREGRRQGQRKYKWSTKGAHTPLRCAIVVYDLSFFVWRYFNQQSALS